ncbi:deoxyribodipyrimidine photo-lyase [Kangiella sp. HZ709]|uniref:FAD-binding domain-containing protein n=1 Tax=Kangiella sp. HZ709 TaxID=2666328 RepID=UPI0012B15A65|nr:deoxyribodipyrimidine photo-lyase [Kangiella sp. HZ709]MRX26824.1 deoxyribodipyrimidine photolyase [Kangiella sp. HZ709]
MSVNKANIVLFKRDLRLNDHKPLQQACGSSFPLIIIFCFETILINDPHYDTRHWRFIWQSLQDLDQHLKQYNSRVHIYVGNLSDTLKSIQAEHGINTIYSHEETGVAATYQRDKALKKWCFRHKIDWKEYQKDAVIRPLSSRKNWDKEWKKAMRSELDIPDLSKANWAQLINYKEPDIPIEWKQKKSDFQTGGTTEAYLYLNSFFDDRGINYSKNISKPEHSRISCSRLSPYLAWGNISLREVYQTLLSHWNKKGWRRALSALSSRLHWHCHFIQKFESESHMEFEHFNRGYQDYPYREDLTVNRHLEAWMGGQTGYPLVDACMRCLHQTGYINFRMRAMLVSFLTHNLMIDWRQGVHHLARLFLDFEPGIHYSQFQMQAGVVGINTIRIYNVIKQSQEQDPEGVFIKKYVPELSSLPKELIHTPWELTSMEQAMYDFEVGKNYPKPIVDIKETARNTRELLWEWRKKPAVQFENQRILARHVRPR